MLMTNQGNGEEIAWTRVRGTIDRPQQLQGILLAANVTLLIANSRTLEDRDLAAVRLASSSLIDLLTELEIIPPRAEGDPR